MVRLTFSSLLLFLLLVQTAWAASPQFTILTEDAPPTNYIDENGELVGSSVEIVEEIMDRIGWDIPIRVMSWARAYEMAKKGPRTMVFSTTRTDEREALFKWVGPIFEQRLVLYKLAEDDLAIKSLDQAKKVSSIGTYFNDAAEQFLLQRGFSNLDRVYSDEINIKRLVTGRIRLWATGDAAMDSRLAAAGVSLDILEEVLELRAIELYLAFSPDTADQVVSRWQSALETMKSEGLYRNIIEKYTGRPAD